MHINQDVCSIFETFCPLTPILASDLCLEVITRLKTYDVYQIQTTFFVDVCNPPES